MSANAGYATLQIIPSARNFARNLRREVNGPLADAGRDIQKRLASDLDGAGRDGSSRLGHHVKRGLDKVGDDSGKSFARRFAERSGKVILATLTSTFKLAFRAIRGAAEVLLPAAFESVSKGAASAVTNAVTSIGTAASTGTAMTAATGGINLLIAALLALAGATAIVATGFVALAPTVYLVGGAFGAMFTLAAGGAASIGVLALASHGLGDAFKELSKDGKVSSETLKKLSPNARSFVREIDKLRKPFGSLRSLVQDKFFAGFGVEIRDLAKRWLPALRGILGGLATRFNRFTKTVTFSLGHKSFIDNIKAGVAGFGEFIDRIARSMPSLIDVFGRLARASVPFLTALGDKLGGLIEHFAAWIAEADKSGKLAQFMKDAGQALRDIWQIGGLVIGIVGELIDTFFPSSDKTSKSFLGGVKDALQNIKDWLADPENKRKIREFMDKLGEFIRKATTEWLPKIIEIGTTVSEWIDKFKGWGDKIEAFKNRVTGIFTALKRATGGILTGVGESVVSGFIRGLANKAGAVVSAVKRYILDQLPAWLKNFLGIGGSAGGVAKKGSAGAVTRAISAPSAVATSRASSTGASAVPLVGNLTLNGATVSDQLAEVAFALRHIQRGGVYAGR